MKHAVGASAWSSPRDTDKTETDGRDPLQGVTPHAIKDAVGDQYWITKSSGASSASRIRIELSPRSLVLRMGIVIPQRNHEMKPVVNESLRSISENDQFPPIGARHYRAISCTLMSTRLDSD